MDDGEPRQPLLRTGFAKLRRLLELSVLTIFCCPFAAAVDASALFRISCNNNPSHSCERHSSDHPQVLPIRSKRAPMAATSSIKTMSRF